MTSTKRKLGDIATIIRGVTFKPTDVVALQQPDTVVCLRTANIQSALDESDLIAIPASLIRREAQYVMACDILLSSANSWNLVGKCCWVPPLKYRAAAGGFISILRAQPNAVNPRYLYHWFASPTTQSKVRSFGNQTTNISNLDINRTLNLDVPLPTLAEQAKIVTLLDAAETLRAKRRLSQKLLKSYARALFVDMFGSPIENPLQWPIRNLQELGSVITGGTPPSHLPEMFGGPIPFVTPGDLESDMPTKRSLSEAGAIESGTVRAGATFVCCIGATIGKVGTAAVRSAFNQQINAVEWGESVDDRYGYEVLKFFKPTIVAWGSSTTLPILKKTSFEQLAIPVPPRLLQGQFARRMLFVDSVARHYKAALSGIDELYVSLQQASFESGS